MDDDKYAPWFCFWNPYSGIIGGIILGLILSIVLWYLPEILDFFEINY